MKKYLIQTFCLFLCFALLLQGCTYNGKLKHDVYHHQDYSDKIDARVLVISDKYYNSTVWLDQDLIYSYNLNDGLPTEVADALSTLFTDVKVGEYKDRKNYDFVTEIEYEAHIHTGPIAIDYEDLLLPYYTDKPILITTLKLTIRNPKTGYAVARYSHSSYHIVPTFMRDPGLFAAGLVSVLSLGLLSPLYIQVRGSKLRRTLERGIEYALYKNIMAEMNEDRVNFDKNKLIENTNTRVDDKYLSLMKATVYITTGEEIGSGFFISPDGYIVTNAHVPGRNRDVGVVLYDERNILDKTEPADEPDPDAIRNKMRFARVIKRNVRRDLALLKMEGNNFPYLTLETNHNNYMTGNKVVAIGAPRAIEWTATEGIISAVRNDNGREVIQTDTAINNGNSGGPLIDLKTKKVIGVNSYGRRPEAELEDLSRGVEGLNFAISSLEVMRTLGVKQPFNKQEFADTADVELPNVPQWQRNYVKYNED